MAASSGIGWRNQRNTQLTKNIRLGQYELIPLDGLGCFDIVNLINQFLSNSNIALLNSIEDTLNRAKQGQPTIVAHFPNVIAKDVDSAGQIVETEINLLKNLLSIHRNSYAEIVGCVLIDLGIRQMYYRIITPDYRGNLLGGDIAGEFPRTILTQMEKVRTNNSLQLYLALYKEALKETKTEFAYFRFWNLIETIARSKNYIGTPLRNWQGNIEKNRNSQNRTIQDSAVELVFELFRETFSSGLGNESFLANHLAQGAISKIIPIWYRHRNCVVHGGGCFPHDVLFCFPNDNKYINCKTAHEEIVNNFGSRDRFTDKYLSSLERATNWIISTEIENG